MQYMGKDQIMAAALAIFDSFTKTCKQIDEVRFFKRPAENKWSPAENVAHLVVSTNTTTLAYTLPAFIVRWIGGRPNRGSKSYEALVEKYRQKLAAGGRASGRFVPTKKNIQTSKAGLVENWEKAASKFIIALKNNTSESKLDDYLVRHPLLGRITLRELCYFTIYHTEHHLNIINSITNPTSPNT